jgi:hypothetical protein
MKVETADYKGNIIRFHVVSDNGILLNTKDVCAALDIEMNCEGSLFCEPCMDMADVIEASFTEGRDDVEFIDWLQKTFVGYELRTPIRPNCDDDWKLN